MYFDTHAHYDDPAFDEDRDEVLSSMKSGGVDLIVDPASDVESAKKARAIAEKYDFVYFAPGVHPESADTAKDGYLDEVAELLRHPKAVAIGEIGLDYHYEGFDSDAQKRIFREQLELARYTKKPVIVHERDACADNLEIIRDFGDIRGVVHCFSGSWETAKTILDLGWYISFTGVVTFKNARRPVEVAEKMPIDRMMIETDSPYMAPVPCRGQRCTSLLLPYIAGRIGEVRGVSAEKIAEITMKNGREFFGIK